MDWLNDHALNFMAGLIIGLVIGYFTGYLKGRADEPW